MQTPHTHTHTHTHGENMQTPHRKAREIAQLSTEGLGRTYPPEPTAHVRESNPGPSCCEAAVQAPEQHSHTHTHTHTHLGLTVTTHTTHSHTSLTVSPHTTHTHKHTHMSSTLTPHTTHTHTHTHTDMHTHTHTHTLFHMVQRPNSACKAQLDPASLH